MQKIPDTSVDRIGSDKWDQYYSPWDSTRNPNRNKSELFQPIRRSKPVNYNVITSVDNIGYNEYYIPPGDTTRNRERNKSSVFDTGEYYKTDYTRGHHAEHSKKEKKTPHQARIRHESSDIFMRQPRSDKEEPANHHRARVKNAHNLQDSVHSSITGVYSDHIEPVHKKIKSSSSKR